MSGYDLQSLKLPKLTGIALRLFAAALDHPLTRGLLLPSLMKQGGVERLRELLAVRLKVTNNPNLPRMVFVQTKKPDGTLVIVPIAEVKDIVKSCIAEF